VLRGCSLNSHEHYEELCALAATGQASQPDLADLKAHLETCPSCRSFTDDVMQLSAQSLSMLAAKRSQCEIPSGMTQRFVARARTEGIAMSWGTIPRIRRNQPLLTAAMGAVAAVVLIAGILTIRKIHPSSSVASQARPSAQQAAVAPTAVPSTTSRAQDAELQELTAAQKEVNSLAATIRSQRDELEALGKVTDSLNSRLTKAEQQNANFRSEKAGWEARATQLQAELEKSRSDKGTSDVALTLQETELRDLRKKVDEQADLLRQQEELTARGSDVRDLVVARNLHIIDVHDRDGDGKSQRAFGRIFYTEGKSLVFYAYDLGNPQKVDARVSFYVWGGRLGAEKPIESLGVFHNDDASDGRWVLTFDDPHVLAQINSVFVTVESSRKAIREPGGRRILFAFLGEKPNHP
jgi:anti-sigma factor ChrR (cupin superfamily)